MDKTAIKNFSVWARNALIRSVTDKCGLIGVRADGIQNPLPQSTKDIQFFDAGTGAPYSISGDEIAKRDSLVRAIREKERDTDYKTAYNYIIEQVAYTWFNRLIAIRFMEVNDYLPSRTRVLSSEQEGKLEPDIIAAPFDAEFDFTAQERDTIIQLKDRGQKEDMDALFRMLFVKQCDALHEFLPVLFQKVDGKDYTELLLNISFTDREGVVYHLVNDIPEDNFDVSKEGQVEIIGWMYQYYNIEPKDETFALLKKNVKITKERIPAATQLFTPDWIVRYMVENSLGRLWVEGHSNNNLKENWKYYLEEAEQEADVQAQLKKVCSEYRDLNPEDIKVIDPCMGSGHILVYCFDVLMQIYEAQGYTQRDAAQSILEYNLYGLDIDERAAQLAYFAVMMKARQYDRRILARGIRPKVYAIEESNHFRRSQLQFFGATMAPIEVNKAKLEITALLDALTDAKEYGSILQVESYDWNLLRRFTENLDAGDQMSMDTIGIDETKTKLLTLIEIGQTMAQKYDVVITNPPYMGNGGMSSKLAEYVKMNFPYAKTDMFSCFIVRNSDMAKKNGFISMITMESWMFLSSFETLRYEYFLRNTLINLVHMPYLGKGGTSMGISFGTAAFIFKKAYLNGYCAQYDEVRYYETDDDGVPFTFPTINEGYKSASVEKFKKIPGMPIAYWISDDLADIFCSQKPLSFYGKPKQGLATGDNGRFLRFWFEPSFERIGFNYPNRDAAERSGKKWFPCNKGGEYCKWFGNNDYVVNWENDGFEIRTFKDEKGKLRSRPQNMDKYFREGLTWSTLSSANLSMRYSVEGNLFETKGSVCFFDDEANMYYALGVLNSIIVNRILLILCPTLDFHEGPIGKIPLVIDESHKERVVNLVKENIELARADWDSMESSYGFVRHPLVPSARDKSEQMSSQFVASRMEKLGCLAWHFDKWEQDCRYRFNQLKANEEELNRIFISVYGLREELKPEVEESDITVHKADLEREIRSLISYAVGCMFGRYSLDTDCLAYAGGEWDSSKYSTIIPDKDNIIPICDDDYFEDDITGRFVKWVESVYGSAALEDNLDYIAKALGNRGNTSREVIRNYFLNDFMKDHLKVYQKRPIYWLYDSGKQDGFKALIYMHRYDQDTTGRIRANYLFKMQRAYENELKRVQDTIDGSSNSREVAQAEKRKEKLTKQLKETRDYDQKLAHLALARIPIDLDDGVKVNYEKIQTAPDGKKLDILAKI